MCTWPVSRSRSRRSTVRRPGVLLPECLVEGSKLPESIFTPTTKASEPPTPIPEEGKPLTQLSLWWFDQLSDIVPPGHDQVGAWLATTDADALGDRATQWIQSTLPTQAQQGVERSGWARQCDSKPDQITANATTISQSVLRYQPSPSLDESVLHHSAPKSYCLPVTLLYQSHMRQSISDRSDILSEPTPGNFVKMKPTERTRPRHFEKFAKR